MYKSNSSGFKGVHWSNRKSKWIAQIKHCGKQIVVGAFDNIELAANAYREAAIKYHGEFAREQMK